MEGDQVTTKRPQKKKGSRSDKVAALQAEVASLLRDLLRVCESNQQWRKDYSLLLHQHNEQHARSNAVREILAILRSGPASHSQIAGKLARFRLTSEQVLGTLYELCSQSIVCLTGNKVRNGDGIEEREWRVW